jgi:hypothetical protein
VKPQDANTIRVTVTVLLGILGLAGCLPAMFTPMMFDAPGSERNPATLILALSVATWPLSCLVAIGLSWGFKKRVNVSLLLLLLPLLNIVGGCVALFLLMAFQGGRFAG